MVGNNAKCPFGASVPNILLIDDVHLCLCELLKLAQVKMSCLELEKVKLDEKFINLLLNMDDCKVATIEAQDDMALNESNIRVVKHNI